MSVMYIVVGGMFDGDLFSVVLNKLENEFKCLVVENCLLVFFFVKMGF